MKYSFNVLYFVMLIITFYLGYITFQLFGYLLFYSFDIFNEFTSLFILKTGILLIFYLILKKVQKDESLKGDLARVNSIRLMKIVLIVFYLYAIFESTNLFYNYK